MGVRVALTTRCPSQGFPEEGAGDKAAQELADAKRQYMQKIMSWNLPDSKAKDIIFLVHTQLRRKQKRAQKFYVRVLDLPRSVRAAAVYICPAATHRLAHSKRPYCSRMHI